MRKKEWRKKAIYVCIVISLSLTVLLPVLLSAQETGNPEVAAYRPVRGYARVLNGGDPDAIYLHLQAGEPDIREVSRRSKYWEEGEVLVRMEGFSTSMSPGDPMLPYQLYQIALPPDADHATLKLEVIRRVEREISESYRVASAPPPEPCQKRLPEKEFLWELEKWGKGKKILGNKNILTYQKDSLYPVENCRAIYGGQLRKWKVATVTFYPLRYNPVKNKLIYTREIDLKISFKRDSSYLKRPEVKALLRDEVFDDRARKIFLNFDRAKQWYKKSLLEETSENDKPGDTGNSEPPPDPNYVIITTENTFVNMTDLSAYHALSDFCYHKEDLGFEVMVVTEHQTRTVDYDPATGYSFTTGSIIGYEDVVGAPAPNQRPEKIRKWLRDNYITLGIKYVLLIGNPDPDNMGSGDLVGDLPMKDCQLHLTADVPTDFYFAELTNSTWDLDGDGYVGEYYSPAGEHYLPAAVTPNLFCVRCEGVLEVTGVSGSGTNSTGISITSDGNTKIWLDTAKDGFTAADVIFDDTSLHWPGSDWVYLDLSNDLYPVKIEYIQSSGDAYCSVRAWSLLSGGDAQFKHDDGTGTYVDYLETDFFNNNDFTGVPVGHWDDRSVTLYYAEGDRGPGGMDFYAEVIVGRIPCYDENEDGILDFNNLDKILNKTIAYGSANIHENPWRRSVLTSCPYVVDTDADGGHDLAKYEWSELLMDEVAPPPLWDWYRIYEEAYPGVFPPAEVADGCSKPKTLAGWNDPGDPDDGKGVVMWMTHGRQTEAINVFDNTQCSSLDDDKPSIVFMGACNNGEPEFSVDFYGNPRVPLGYENLKNGAIATISATRTSYG